MLPKIQYPILTLTIPHSRAPNKFRPFTVKEEKLLLMAKASSDESDMLQAIKQTVSNCSLTDLDVDALTVYDVEYLWLKLRAASISNTLELSYLDAEDSKQYSIEVNLDDVEVTYPEGRESRIPISETAGILLRDPPARIYGDKRLQEMDPAEVEFAVIRGAISQVWDGDQVYEAETIPDEELEVFIDSLEAKTFEKIQEFFKKTPRIEHVVSYVNSRGTEQKITLSALTDFFSLR